MSRISDLVKEINDLPKGYISKKIIHGKDYYYLQKRVEKKLVSTYIKREELDKYKTLISKREKLEKELDNILNEGNKSPVLSKTASELTGFLMSEDTKIAEFNNGILVGIISEELCPLYILRTNNIDGFIKLRSIDSGRTNYRLLKKVLNIKDDSKVGLYAYGATITDNYWFKPKGSSYKYKDISFNNDFYSDLALNGELIVYPKKPKLTPEITTPGSFEKCWKKKGKEWWLYKKGTENEIFSELFCSKLAELLNINTAIYEREDNNIKTKNFADRYNFEPMVSIASDDDSYDNVYKNLSELNDFLVDDYLLLIWFDTLVNNVDRHNENCGLLRDRANGKIISLAPNFDNNMALVSRSEVLNCDCSRDGLITYFSKFVKKNDSVRSRYKRLRIPVVNENILNECFKQIGSDYLKADITKYLINRYTYINRIIM